MNSYLQDQKMNGQPKQEENKYLSLLLFIVKHFRKCHQISWTSLFNTKKYESYFFLLLDLLLSILLVNNGHNRTMCLVYFIPVLKVLCLDYTEGHWYCTFLASVWQVYLLSLIHFSYQKLKTCSPEAQTTISVNPVESFQVITL